MEKVNVYDWDKTIFPVDSTAAFYGWCVRCFPKVLLALPAIIPELKKMEIHLDITHSDMSMDLMLDTEFLSVEDMKIYANHPEHLKVSAFIRSVIESRVVLDTEI